MLIDSQLSGAWGLDLRFERSSIWGSSGTEDRNHASDEVRSDTGVAGAASWTDSSRSEEPFHDN
jgi:hypothetical protein